jgi:uncharacterized protein with PQ loop repeat
MNLVVTALAVFSEFAGVVATAVQVQRVYRTKNVRGISVLKNTLVGSSMIGWFAYGTTSRIWPVVIANGLMIPMMFYLLYLLAHSKKRNLVYSSMLVCGLLLAVVLLRAPDEYAGWLSVSFMIIALSPQLKKVLTEKKIDGLSRSAEVLWLLVGVTTFAYAFVLNAWPLVVAGAVGVAYSTVVLLLLERKHPRHKH